MLQEIKSTQKKASSKQQGKPPATYAKAVTRKKSNKVKKFVSSPVSAEQRQQMIAEAAYFIAEHHGFATHSPLEDWLVAETEVDRQINQNAV